METKDLLKCSPGELTDMGICPTCFNREHNGLLYGDNKDKMLYEDEDIECFLVGNPRSEGHMAISTIQHYHDMSEAPDEINEKIIRYTKKFMQIIKKVTEEVLFDLNKCNRDPAHQGLVGITNYLYAKNVPVHIHGHIHENYDNINDIRQHLSGFFKNQLSVSVPKK